jgi:hypothetical protein
MIKLFENPDIPSSNIGPEITIRIYGKRTSKSFNKKKFELLRGQFTLFCEQLETELASYSIRIASDTDSESRLPRGE